MEDGIGRYKWMLAHWVLSSARSGRRGLRLMSPAVMNFTGAVSIIFYDINKSKYIFILTLINLLALYSSTEILTFLARITPLIRLSRNFPWLSSF